MYLNETLRHLYIPFRNVILFQTLECNLYSPAQISIGEGLPVNSNHIMAM